MDSLKRCPACQSLQPTIQFEKDETVTIACKIHGYEMTGETLEQAVANWNRVVIFVNAEKVA